MPNNSSGASDPRIAITGFGMLTSLGQASQCCAAARAGLRRVVEWEGYFALGLDEEFDAPAPISAALAPLAVKEMNPVERLVDLSLPAIEEALQSASLSRGDLARTNFSICLSTPPDQNENPALGQAYLGMLYEAGALPPMRENRVYFQGHAAGVVALLDAAAFLSRGDADYCLLGGAETFLDVELLDQLDRDFRLKSPRALDGYSPGEAAVFVILERVVTAQRRGVRPRLLIDAVGLAMEPAPLKSKDVCTSQGLCGAIRSAVDSARAAGASAPSGWTVSDFNGERWRAREWGLALPRLNSQLGENVVHWHPAQNFGDVGSASAPLLFAVAAHAFDGGYAPGKTALILASSAGPERAAVLLSPGPPPAREN